MRYTGAKSQISQKTLIHIMSECVPSNVRWFWCSKYLSKKIPNEWFWEAKDDKKHIAEGWNFDRKCWKLFSL